MHSLTRIRAAASLKMLESAGALAMPVTAYARGDAAAGEKVFDHCPPCSSEPSCLGLHRSPYSCVRLFLLLDMPPQPPPMSQRKVTISILGPARDIWSEPRATSSPCPCVATSMS